MTIRTLSLALTAVVTLTASTAAFSGDNPREIKFLSSYSWGTGCPFNTAKVVVDRQALFPKDNDVKDSISIEYPKSGHMKIVGDSSYETHKERWCTTRLTVKLPAGVTFGDMNATFNHKFDFDKDAGYDRVEVNSRINAFEINLFNPVRKDSWYKEGFNPLPRNDGFEFKDIGDRNHAFCGIPRIASIYITNSIALDAFGFLGDGGKPSTAELEGIYFKMPIKKGSNGVACDGYDWEDEVLGNIKPAY